MRCIDILYISHSSLKFNYRLQKTRSNPISISIQMKCFFNSEKVHQKKKQNSHKTLTTAV